MSNRKRVRSVPLALEGRHALRVSTTTSALMPLMAIQHGIRAKRGSRRNSATGSPFQPTNFAMIAVSTTATIMKPATSRPLFTATTELRSGCFFMSTNAYVRLRFLPCISIGSTELMGDVHSLAPMQTPESDSYQPNQNLYGTNNVPPSKRLAGGRPGHLVGCYVRRAEVAIPSKRGVDASAFQVWINDVVVNDNVRYQRQDEHPIQERKHLHGKVPSA